MKQQFLHIDDSTMTIPAFTGFINVCDGKIYTSQTLQTNTLSATNHPQSIALVSDYYNDWVCGDELKLPYQPDDILLQPNELVHAHVVNDTFRKLYNNIEYILSRCFFYTNNIPTEYLGWFGNNLTPSNTIGDKISYNTSTTYTKNDSSIPLYQYLPCQFIGLSNLSIEEQLISGIFGKENSPSAAYLPHLPAVSASDITKTDDSPISSYNIDDKSIYKSKAKYDSLVNAINFISNNTTYSICIFKTHIEFNTITDTSFKPATGIDIDIDIISSFNDTTNDTVFKHIVDATLDDDGNMYIADNGNNVVVQYDLRYILNGDDTKAILKNIIGSEDSLNSQPFKWKTIKFIRCAGNNVFICDPDENCILVFDKHLNYKKCIGNIGFKQHPPVSVTYRILHHEYHILCNDGKVFKFDDNFELLESYQLDCNDCVDIDASTCDSNIFYITTKSSVIEKLFSNNKTIGLFEFSKYGTTDNTNVCWGNTASVLSDYKYPWGGEYNFPLYKNKFEVIATSIRMVNNIDEMWVFANNGRMLWFRNNPTLKSLLCNNQLHNYNLNNIKCSEDDYVQGFTYNRLIYKFINILISMISQIAYKPTYMYNSAGLLIFNQLEYNIKEIDLVSQLDNLKIHNNDILTTDVINRVLTHLINIEQNILNSIKMSITNTTSTKYDNLIIKQ